MGAEMASDGPELDTQLLDGFGFVCRPDCGLCCYASPRIARPELRELLAAAPEAQLVARGSDRFLAARPHGGACQFLTERRCGVHAARPSPCREFPVTVHVGERLQASLVLSCPGLDLRPLLADAPGAPARAFEGELAAVRRRIDASVQGRVDAAARRRRRLVRALEAEGLWMSEAEVRRRLRARAPLPGAEEFPVEDPPEVSEGWEQLPLFFDGRAGPVGISRAMGGWALHELSPMGGAAHELGVVPPPTRPPTTTEEGAAVLARYLDYWLDRDAFFGSVLLGSAEARLPVLTVAELELRAVGAQVLVRAEVRAKLRGLPSDPLSAAAIADGIRATDQDWLDRPTWGDRL